MLLVFCLVPLVFLSQAKPGLPLSGSIGGASFSRCLRFLEWRNQQDGALCRPHNAFSRAPDHRALHHALTVDIHHEQIRFFLVEDPQDPPVRRTEFDSGGYVAPVPDFGRHQIVELFLNTTQQ